MALAPTNCNRRMSLSYLCLGDDPCPSDSDPGSQSGHLRSFRCCCGLYLASQGATLRNTYQRCCHLPPRGCQSHPRGGQCPRCCLLALGRHGGHHEGQHCCCCCCWPLVLGRHGGHHKGQRFCCCLFALGSPGGHHEGQHCCCWSLLALGCQAAHHGCRSQAAHHGGQRWCRCLLLLRGRSHRAIPKSPARRAPSLCQNKGWDPRKIPNQTAGCSCTSLCACQASPAACLRAGPSVYQDPWLPTATEMAPAGIARGEPEGFTHGAGDEQDRHAYDCLTD